MKQQLDKNHVTFKILQHFITYFRSMFHFHTPLKTSCCLMFLGGVKREHCPKAD